ncbi:MAG: hypothetical protein ACYC6K_05895 [Bellilinea sp.]
MRRIHRTISLHILLITSTLLTGCFLKKDQTTLEQSYVDIAVNVLENYNLPGEVIIELDHKDGYEQYFNLIINSDDFEELDDGKKEIILKLLSRIDSNYPRTVTLIVKALDNTYTVDDEVALINGVPLIALPTPVSKASGNVIGEWIDTGWICPNIVIRKVGSSYKMTTTCNDGSSETKTLTIEMVNGQERLYENPGNLYGDYMVIRTNGNLAFYDDQGVIKVLQPE